MTIFFPGPGSFKCFKFCIIFEMKKLNPCRWRRRQPNAPSQRFFQRFWSSVLFPLSAPIFLCKGCLTFFFGPNHAFLI